jgi:hypothetical protein
MCGEEDHRGRVGLAGELLLQLEPARAGKSIVEHDTAGSVLDAALQEGARGLEGLDAEARGLEETRQAFPDGWIVVDHEDVSVRRIPAIGTRFSHDIPPLGGILLGNRPRYQKRGHFCGKSASEGLTGFANPLRPAARRASEVWPDVGPSRAVGSPYERRARNERGNAHTPEESPGLRRP